jgi:Sec-independent protein translocase protein TatA
MGALSIWHLIVLLAVVMFVVGAGKRHAVSNFLGDVGLGLRKLKDANKDDARD